MTKSKTLSIALVALSLFAVGCASGGMKKPTVFIDQYNNIPADIPSQFPNRYEQYISGKELKEFKKLLTDEERQVFIDKFWTERDPDPSTPENEYKEEVDKRIDNIVNESFLSTLGVFGLSFRSNGGFRGDMAQVYLLHGEPYAMDTIEGDLFVPLMLWIYGDPSNIHAFLFYQKGSSGSFSLFSQDSYQLDQCGAVNEIKKSKELNFYGGNQGCPPDVEQIFREIQTTSSQGGVIDGRIFAWSLFNFSQDGSISQGAALAPPKPASEIARQSKASVRGEASELSGTAGTDYILASCAQCNSFIPAELSMGERFTVFGLWKNFDWTVKGEYLEVSLKYRIVLQDRNAGKPMILEGLAGMRMKKSSLDENPEAIVIVDLLSPEQVVGILPGKYRVSVYVKNTMTGKYNAWSDNFIK